MMKRFVSLVLILCLFFCTALAADGDLPDIEAFSNGLLEIVVDKITTESDCITKKYTGTNEDVLFVFTRYIDLLTEEEWGDDDDFYLKYGFEEMARIDYPAWGDICHFRGFKYTKDVPQIDAFNSAFFNEHASDETNFIYGCVSDLHVSIDCIIGTDDSKRYNNESRITIYYSSGFNYIDTGDRIDLSERPTVAPTATPTAAPTAAPTATPEKCPICNGTGKCPKCGGDMWFTGYVWEYVNGFPVSVLKTKLCHGQYCYGGACDKCGGDGWLDDKRNFR